MSSSESIIKGFGEALEISGTFSDNWGIERIDWMIDGNVLESNYSVDGGSSSISIEVTNDYSPGTHIVSLLVTDKSGRSTQVTRKSPSLTSPHRKYCPIIPKWMSQLEIQ